MVDIKKLKSRTAAEVKSVAPEASDYVGTLLRDPTSSHLLETLVRRLPQDVFDIVWTTYLQNKLARLAAHPVANFIVAKALERVSEAQLAEACQEIQPVSGKVYSGYNYISRVVLRL